MVEISSFSGIQQRNVMNGDDNKNISHCSERAADQGSTLNTVNEMSKNHHANFNATNFNNTDDTKNNGNSNRNAAEKLNIISGKEYNTNLCVDDCIERRGSNEKIVKERIHTNKSSTNITDNKMPQRNVQGLAFGDVEEKDERNNENKEKHEELCDGLKHKTASMNLSRKAKSFFRKKSRLAIVDSNCTLILPGPRRVRSKQYEKTYGDLRVSQLLNRRITNSIRIKSNAPKQGRMNSRSLTNLQADNSHDRPTTIPLKTQDLLNKNYWEYYRKLKRKLAPTKPDTASGKRANEPQDHLPESQTLQQCSMLSCMINTALRDSTTVDKKSLSDPAANVISNVRENVFGLSSARKRKKTKQTSKLSLELKIIGM